jgi:hypothetical protein
MADPILTQNKNPLTVSDGFRLIFQRAPNVEFFLQEISLPGVSVNEVAIARPHLNAYVPGDKLVFEPLSVQVLVSEDMDNYKEIFEWLQTSVVENDTPKKYSDITLYVLTSKNNPNKRIIFKNAFPISIGAINFSVKESEIVYGTIDMSFRYDYFTFE